MAEESRGQDTQTHVYVRTRNLVCGRHARATRSPPPTESPPPAGEHPKAPGGAISDRASSYPIGDLTGIGDSGRENCPVCLGNQRSRRRIAQGGTRFAERRPRVRASDRSAFGRVALPAKELQVSFGVAAALCQWNDVVVFEFAIRPALHATAAIATPDVNAHVAGD